MPASVGNPSTLQVPRALKWHHRCAAALIVAAIRLLAFTIRYRWHFDSGSNQPGSADHLPDAAIFCLWHNRLGLSLHIRAQLRRLGRHAPMAGLVSASKDGGILALVMQAFDVVPIRGSSSRRGYQALRELTTLSRRGFDIAITPDGPRGPRYQAKEGVVSLAQLSDHPIVPVAVHYSRRIRLGSWDQFQIPLPFSRCDIHFASPIVVPRTADAKLRDEIRKRLEQSLAALTHD